MTDEIDLGIEGLGPATLLDRGGSAYVYQAEQLAFGRKVAVKVLFQALEDPDTFRRFERECLALGAVSDHPNIVVVHGRGLTEDDRPYLIMEHRQGGSLADQIKTRGRFTETQTIQIGKKVAQALSVAHGAGVIHRDVKPGNILLSQYGEPALADFGIARMDGASKTTAGILTASVNHASREVLNGDQATIQSDVYSLGSTLFTLATGRAPFVDPSDDSVWTLIERVVTTDPPDAGYFGVSPPLAAVLQSALTHDLTSRYQTADELAQALEDLSSGRGVVANKTADTKQFVVSGLQMPIQVRTEPGHANVVSKPQDMAPVQPLEVSPTIAPLSAASLNSNSKRRPFLMAALGSSAVVLIATMAWFLLPQLRIDRGIPVSDAAGPPLGADQESTNLAGLAENTGQPEENAITDGPILDLRQAEIGPLAVDGRYALTLEDDSDDKQYQILLNGEAITEPEDSVPVFFPTRPGRFELTVEILDEDGSVTSSGVDIYVSTGSPEPGFRANLASVRSVPSNWPLALQQFDELRTAGHSDLKLSLSSRGQQDGLPFWNFYIDGFGEDRSSAQAYCDQRDLGPEQCFPASVDASAAES